MDVLEAIATRSSVSALSEPGPTDTQLAILLRAAARAPDHARLRPWRFLIIRGEARQRFGDLVADALRASEPGVAPEALDRERLKPLRAPAILVVAVTPTPHPKVPEIEQILAGGAATQNILLAAHALGLGAIWRTGAPAHDPRVVEALGFPPQTRIIGFVYLGAPTAPAKRMESEDRALAVEWGDEPREFDAAGATADAN